HHRASLRVSARALVSLPRAAALASRVEAPEAEASAVGAADVGPTSGSNTTSFSLVVLTTDLGSTVLPTTAMNGRTSASRRRRYKPLRRWRSCVAAAAICGSTTTSSD